MKMLENMCEADTVKALREWPTTHLTLARKLHHRIERQAFTFGKLASAAGSTFMLVCIDRVLDERAAR